MSWIKDHKFGVALGGGTLAGAVLIFMAGSQQGAQYRKAKESFDIAATKAATYEKLPFYPRPELVDAKNKALGEYRQATDSLQAAFANYRPQALKNVSPQDFTNQLKAVNEEIRKACEASGTKLPDQFFCGFENYKTTLAKSNATGMLNYELTAIQRLMLALAKSDAFELKNLHRPQLVEERGQIYTPKATDVARPLSLEITFSGPEKAVRAYVSEILRLPDYYVVIRSIAVENSKKDPPRTSDAKFDRPIPAGGTAPEDSFSGAFVMPTEVPAVAPPATGTSAVPPSPAPAGAGATSPAVPPVAPIAPIAPIMIPPPVAPDTEATRILAQVLGKEEVHVFLRLDILQFLPAKKLP